MRRALALTLVLPLLAGVAGAVVWSRWADPALWTVHEGQLQMGQEAVATEIGVPLAFAAVGVVGGLLLGFLIGLLSRQVDWPLVFVGLLSAGVATLVAWRLGIVLGPPDPVTVAGLSEGDTVQARLTLNLPAAFLAWPAATLAGLMPGVGLNPRGREPSARYGGDDAFGEVDQVGR
ncbi:MAG: hypothetical protein QM597_09565 [Aeromicrobium sp.]|uniref:hypothetical protein n=1 Tax=Aeromicrobium sp. TaxID=1871063 RepID=UPI0039E5E580